MYLLDKLAQEVEKVIYVLEVWCFGVWVLQCVCQSVFG